MKHFLIFLRNLLLSFTTRCPHCRGEPMRRNWYVFNKQCSHCGFIYQKDEGDFWGGMVLSYTFAAVIGLAIAMVMILIGGFRWETVVYTSALTALASILVHFPFSKSMWIYLLYHTRGQYEDYAPPEKPPQPGSPA